MVVFKSVTGSTVADVATYVSIPEDALLIGFDVAAYQTVIVIAYAYKV